MTYYYQSGGQFFAQIADELKDLGCSELIKLGAANIQPVFRGIRFEATHSVLYSLIYSTRFITRVLAPLISFDCHSTKYLYKTAVNINWTDFFSIDQTFAIFGQVSNSKITHSRYAALCLKDAIADYFRLKTGKRPNVDTKAPDVWFNIHIENNKATVSLDVSGDSLHKRGYRILTVDAPMQETLAAAIIELSEWDGSHPLIDPLCGSGTLLAEAIIKYCRIPTGFQRTGFGFFHLPDFEPKTWETVKNHLKGQIRPLPVGIISGSDMDPKAVRATRRNLQELTKQPIPIQVTDFQSIERLYNFTIVGNPPYGVRLQQKDGLAIFYQNLGNFLKQRCVGSTAFLYFGDRSFLKNIGLRSSWKKSLKNGGLDGRLAKFELY